MDPREAHYFTGVEKVAGETHRKISLVQDAADALAADGIRADLLKDALQPINQRMAASAALAGWPAPSITEDMDVIREDGLVYELLSESAQWRMSAVVADAISGMSGLNVLILDRMDVLDLTGRAQALRWVAKLAEDGYETILVMATLKEPPKGLPANIKATWLASGAA
jgi:hypothetical protein